MNTTNAMYAVIAMNRITAAVAFIAIIAKHALNEMRVKDRCWMITWMRAL